MQIAKIRDELDELKTQLVNLLPVDAGGPTEAGVYELIQLSGTVLLELADLKRQVDPAYLRAKLALSDARAQATVRLSRRVSSAVLAKQYVALFLSAYGSCENQWGTAPVPTAAQLVDAEDVAFFNTALFGGQTPTGAAETSFAAWVVDLQELKADIDERLKSVTEIRKAIPSMQSMNKIAAEQSRTPA